MNFGKKCYFSEQMKCMKISIKIKTTICLCLLKRPLWNDHFELKFMRVYWLPKDTTISKKIRKIQNCSMAISKASVVLKFMLSLTSSLLQNAAKKLKIRLNLWAIELGICCINVYGPHGKILAAPDILSSVYTHNLTIKWR